MFDCYLHICACIYLAVPSIKKECIIFINRPIIIDIIINIIIIIVIIIITFIIILSQCLWTVGSLI